MRKKVKKKAKTSRPKKNNPFHIGKTGMRIGLPIATGAAAWVLSGTVVLGLLAATAVGVATHWHKISPSERKN